MRNITRHFLFAISIFTLYSNPILLASPVQEESIVDSKSTTKSAQQTLLTDRQLLHFLNRKEALQEEGRDFKMFESLPRSPDEVKIDDALEKFKKSAHITEQEIQTILAKNIIPQEEVQHKSFPLLPADITIEELLENLNVLIDITTLSSNDYKRAESSISSPRKTSVRKSTKDESPKTRKKANSTSKTATSSTTSKSINDLVEDVLPSKPQPPFEPKKVAFLGVEVNPDTGEEEAIMKVQTNVRYVSAPPKLSPEELEKIFFVQLEYKIIDLGGTTISGMVAKKQPLQNGMASHKEPEATVKRIQSLIQEYPTAYAIRMGDEKSVQNTLAALGYKGVVGRFTLQVGTNILTYFNLAYDEIA